MQILDEIRVRLESAVNEPENNKAQLAYMVRSTKDMAALLKASYAVLELHPPTSIYELDDEGRVQSDDESKFVRNICGTCSDSHVTEDLDDGNYDLAGSWGEVTWPCPTVAAVTSALEAKE